MTAQAPTGDADWLERQLAQALERIAAGQHADIAALCAERPHLRAELDAALGLRSMFADVAAAARTDDGDAPRTDLLAGRYRLQAELGRGAAGVVYRAFDEHLRRLVAIKTLHAGRLHGASIERFAREARVLAQLAHAHTVPVHDHGNAEDGRPFLVMELLHGTSLQTVLDAAIAAMPDGPAGAAGRSTDWLARRLPSAALESSWLRQAVRWVAELGDGLAAAHAAGIWHRDVKPGNAFVCADGRAVLLDFGIAARDGDATVTAEHAIVGTPVYMAPEQAMGRVEPGPELDVYGLSATLYHLLTLRAPFAGDVGTVLRALRDGEPVPAGRLQRGLPVDVQAILDCGLARRPADRYRAVADMVADLHAFLEHRPVSVRRLGPMRRAWRRVRRQPMRTTAVLAGAVAVMSLAVLVPSLSALSHVTVAAEARALREHLPADLAIEGYPEERLFVPLGEQQALIAQLDRLLALAPDDAGVRLVRAALRLDAGDRTGAAADFAELARRDHSPYLQAVAARFLAADPQRAGVMAVDLTDLPAPTTPTDCFVAGFHALRARDSEAADDLLRRAGEFAPARDLRLLAMLGRKQPDAEAIVAEAGRLEGLYGRPTARTRHALGAAMLMLRRWEKAVPYCEEALRLRPDRHGPWNNLGLAHLRLGHHALARDCYEHAVAIRPWFANSRSGLSQTLRALGDFAGAREQAEAIRDVCWREHELGNIDVAEALLARRNRATARRRELAGSALGHFAAAQAATADTRNPRATGLPTSAAYAQALQVDDVGSTLAAFVDMVRGEPRNAQQLANLADLLADQEVDDGLRDRLRLLLLDQAVDLAPEDAGNRAMRDALRKQLQNEQRRSR